MMTAISLMRRLNHVRVWDLAAVLAFNTLLGMIPLMGFAMWLMQHLPIPALQPQHLIPWLITHLFGQLPPHAQDSLTQLIAQACELSHKGILVLLASSLWMLGSIQQVFARLGMTKMTWRDHVSQTIIMVLLVQLIALTSGLIVALQGLLLRWVHQPMMVWMIEHAWTLAPLCINFMITMLMYHTLAAKQLTWRAAALGALFTTLGLELTRWALLMYVTLVPSYQMIYGSFAVIPVMLLWIYLAWLIILAGAIISYEQVKKHQQTEA